MRAARPLRIKLAIALISASVLLNVVVLAVDDASPGWTLAAIVLLAAAGVSLLVERRER